MPEIIHKVGDVPEPKYDDRKELYAFFGMAYYHAVSLEHGVLNLAVAMHARKDEGVTVGDVLKLYESFDKHTFGRIINRAKELFCFPDEIEADLARALDYRNYLAHKFFIDHDTDLLIPRRRNKMIDELIEIIRFLKPLDARMDTIWKSAWKAMGITEEWIDQQFEALVRYKMETDE